MNIDDKASDYIINDDEGERPALLKVENQEKSFSFVDLLKSKTGSGTIESYNSHPLNFNNSKSISQIIRGVSGMFGNLDFALLDIVMGIFSFMSDRKKVVTDEL